MPKSAKKHAKKSGEELQEKTVHVGDRVRVRIAALSFLADVVEDRGYIGKGGRHFVHVAWVDQAGDPQRMDWPADELTVVRRRSAADKPAKRRSSSRKAAPRRARRAS